MANHTIWGSSPWLAVFVAGSPSASFSLLEKERVRRAAAADRSSTKTTRPFLRSTPKESSRRADEFLSDLMDKAASFVGGRAAALYVLAGRIQVPTLRTCVGIELTSEAVWAAIDVGIAEARPVAMADDPERTWMALCAPLVIGDRVTGVIVVSAPRRWSRVRWLHHLQQVAEGSGSDRSRPTRRRGMAQQARRRPMREDTWRSWLKPPSPSPPPWNRPTSRFSAWEK